MPRHILTSLNNPLQIAELPLGSSGGLIGITFAPGKQQPAGLSGRHARNLSADLDHIAVWNASVVVTLIEEHELHALGISHLGVEVRLRHMEWHHLPIRDYHAPNAAFEAAWPERSARLRTLLSNGGRVLVHCKGGLGRAGAISARLLVESGVAAELAIQTVRAVRPGSIETAAQERWVAAGQPTPLPVPAGDRAAARDRAVGALLGLAVGDAVGATLEFSPKPRLAVLDDMLGGGPHRLQRGQWTDDTAMALALADSLLEDSSLNPTDLMSRFVDWHEHGTYSCTGTCFDIGTATLAALNRFGRNGNPLAGSSAPEASGNGALMRLSPVAIRHWRDRDELRRVAAVQTRATHGSPATLTASSAFATLLADAISGRSLVEILGSTAAETIEGGWRGLHRDCIEGSGYVVESLRAAVWAVSRTTDFRSALLLAANLGRDADTTAAIAGQLAGAVYGASNIPQDWLGPLAWCERLESTAGRLFDAGELEPAPSVLEVATLGNEFAAPWMTGDWTLRERLAALAAFRPTFEAQGFRPAETVPSRRDDDVIVFGGFLYDKQVIQFIEAAYEYGWVRSVDWTGWRETERGRTLMSAANAIEAANDDELASVVTVCIRADRFCDGYLAEAFEQGLIPRVVARAEQLLHALHGAFRRESVGQ